MRLSASLAALAIATSATQAQGPILVNPGAIPGATRQQIAVNPAAVLAARGFGGFSGQPGLGGLGAAPLPIGGIGVSSPYSLSTVGGASPFLGGTLGTSPYGVGGYGLSTVPGGAGFNPYAFSPYGPYFQDPQSGYLQGVASVTSATGDYWLKIQQAKLIREQARQARLDTGRKRIEFEMWYERLKPRTQDIIDAGVRDELERARRDPSTADVTDGRSLNALLNNVNKLGELARGPNISLEEDTLKNINLTVKDSNANSGLLKDNGKITWPLAMHDKLFGVQRERLTKNIEQAVDAIKSGGDGKADPALLQTINQDLRDLQRAVDNSQDDLTIGQYLQAKSFMRQLTSAVRFLSEPQAKKFLNNTWNAKGRNVQQLIANMRDAGLQFAPAAPGDEAAYMSLYYALRSFESGLALASPK